MSRKNNKFYWLKLEKGFFKRHDIRIIESMENGKDYILFYLKLLLESIDHNGHLRFSELIPYNEKMLSTITNTNIDIVRSAMKVFTELKMIVVMDDETIYMNELQKLVGSETQWAKYKRDQRERQQLETTDNKNLTLSNDSPTQVQKSPIEIEIELDKELDIDKDNIKKVNQKKPLSVYEKVYFENEKVNSIFIEFLRLRKQLKAVNNERAINTLINKLNKVNDQAKIVAIEESIMNSWKGVFPKENAAKQKLGDRW